MLEKVFADGAVTIDEVVAGLNAQAFRTAEGGQWTTTSFEAEMARLGA